MVFRLAAATWEFEAGLPDSRAVGIERVEVRDAIGRGPILSLSRLEIVRQYLLDRVGETVVNEYPTLSWGETGANRDTPATELGGRYVEQRPHWRGRWWVRWWVTAGSMAAVACMVANSAGSAPHSAAGGPAAYPTTLWIKASI